MKNWLINKIVGFVPQIGNRVHLHSIRGHYEVIEILSDGIVVTCRIWQAQNNYPKQRVTRFVKFKDIKSLYKGVH